MAHTYVFGLIQYPTNAVGDPFINVSGTVDGTPVTTGCWYSDYISHAASAISAQNFIIGLLLAAYNKTIISTPPNAPISGLTVTV
jgi:hypothetical protein